MEDDGHRPPAEPATCEPACCPHTPALVVTLREKGMLSGSKRDQIGEDAEEAARKAEQDRLHLIGNESQPSKEGIAERKKTKGTRKKEHGNSVGAKAIGEVRPALGTLHNINTDEYLKSTDQGELEDSSVEDDGFSAAWPWASLRTPAAKRSSKSKKAHPSLSPP